jgi:hypothetical protein
MSVQKVVRVDTGMNSMDKPNDFKQILSTIFIGDLPSPNPWRV